MNQTCSKCGYHVSGLTVPFCPECWHPMKENPKLTHSSSGLENQLSEESIQIDRVFFLNCHYF